MQYHPGNLPSSQHSHSTYSSDMALFNSQVPEERTCLPSPCFGRVVVLVGKMVWGMHWIQTSIYIYIYIKIYCYNYMHYIIYYIYIYVLYIRISKKRVPCSRWVIPKILLPSVQDIFKPLLFLPWAMKHMQIRARMVRWSNQLYSWWWPWDLTPGSMLHGHESTPADKIHITGFRWFLDPQKSPNLRLKSSVKICQESVSVDSMDAKNGPKQEPQFVNT